MGELFVIETERRRATSRWHDQCVLGNPLTNLCGDSCVFVAGFGVQFGNRVEHVRLKRRVFVDPHFECYICKQLVVFVNGQERLGGVLRAYLSISRRLRVR